MKSNDSLLDEITPLEDLSELPLEAPEEIQSFTLNGKEIPHGENK